MYGKKVQVYFYISCRCQRIFSFLGFKFCGFLPPGLNSEFGCGCGGKYTVYRDIQCRCVKIVRAVKGRLSTVFHRPALY